MLAIFNKISHNSRFIYANIFLLLIIYSLPAFAENKTNFIVGGSAGVPDLLNMQLGFKRLSWFQAGFGIGKQPVQKLIDKYVSVSPESYAKDINETYRIIPKIDVNIMAYNMFFRVFPGTESFYLQAKYTTWNLRVSAEAIAQNKINSSQASIGSLSFQIIQPMGGAQIGFMNKWNTGFFIDYGMGAAYLFQPSTNYSIGGLAGAALNMSVLDPAIQQQVVTATNTMNDEIDKAIREARKKIVTIPVIYFTSGWVF